MKRAELDEACWLVTNGERTVGPVCMGALLDAVGRGALSSDCLARKPEWLEWRALTQLREVAALRSAAASAPPLEERVGELLSSASDRSEVVHLALCAAVTATGATLGWAHRRTRRRGRLLTVCQFGPVPERLGALGPHVDDAVLAHASSGAVVTGAVHGGPAEGAIARRFSVPVSGVAMLPVLGQRELWGLVEIARTDHVFRKDDRRLLELVARHARACFA